MTRLSPELDRPCPGWKIDLPKPDLSVRNKIDTAPRINSQNSTYLEISRRIPSRRNLTLTLGITQLIVSIYCLGRLLEGLLFSNAYGFDAEGIALLFLATIIFTLAPIYLLSAAILPPRDCPIRFNRVRRMVYVYEFKQNWVAFPTRWRVTTHSFAWDDLRAEFWRQRGFTPQGGLIITWGVSIAVVMPGTNQVISRFPLTVCQDEGSSWDYVRTYMQQGPDALPVVEQCKDPNDVLPHNLALSLAPKVRWPAQMDAESRSGPG